MRVPLDTPGSAAYSPVAPPLDNPLLPDNRATVGEPANSPELVGGPVERGSSLLPPDPTVGGQTTQRDQLGWTTGLRLSRAFRQRFTGATLVVPNMGAHPAVGPVGYSTRSQRLANGVQALSTDFLPSTEAIAASFVSPGLNAVQREMLYPSGDGA
jgi:hypothetical protein